MEEEMESDGIGPCPWCGHDLKAETDDLGDGYIGHVRCGGCDMQGPISDWKYDTVEDAKAGGVDAWNSAKFVRVGDEEGLLMSIRELSEGSESTAAWRMGRINAIAVAATERAFIEKKTPA